jgi:sugar phosphate isomerase/epimerase
MAHDVFISHSSLDKPQADAVCAGLESAGIRCWIAPRDILPSAIYAEAIMEAIESSRVMVVLFSSHSNVSPHVQREVERAIKHRLAIIPLRIDNVTPTRAMEYFLGTPHWLDALTPPFDGHIRRLADAVGALLGMEGGPAEEAPSGPLPPGQDVEVIDFDRIGERSGSLWSRFKNRLLGEG